MSVWRRKREPVRRDCLEIMREATQLRNEIALKPGYDRMLVIERRMRELAVEIGALPADALDRGGDDGDR